jgi:copper chaperone CopZ
VRPHPRFGTLELRIADQPTRLETTAAVATLLHAMASRLEAKAPADRGLYAQNRWAALRFGHHAELVHPHGSRLVSVSDLLQELLARLGIEPVDVPDQALEQLEAGRGGVPLQTDTIQVTGVRCERCVMRLGASLKELDGLEAANANLMGQVMVAWDDERLARKEILEALQRGGFTPLATPE